MGPIRTEIVGVKCDARGCGWEDMTVPRSAYPAWRNAACPRCGSNVFTDADWKAMRRAEIAVGIVNTVLFWMKPPADHEPAHETSLHFSGDGRPAIRTSAPPLNDGAPASTPDAGPAHENPSNVEKQA